MPRRPILTPRSGYAGQASPYFEHAVRHDVIFPNFGSRQTLEPEPPGRETLQREVRETEVRLDHLLEEKRTLERKREELQELNDKQSQYRDRRDKIVDEVLRTLNELQKCGHFEVRRAETFDRAGSTVHRLRLNLENLHRLELKEPSDFPALSDGIRRLRDAEAELESELSRIENVESAAPATHLFASVAPDRRSFLGWARLGLSFFLPVLTVGLVVVIIAVAVVGVR